MSRGGKLGGGEMRMCTCGDGVARYGSVRKGKGKRKVVRRWNLFLLSARVIGYSRRNSDVDDSSRGKEELKRGRPEVN